MALGAVADEAVRPEPGQIDARPRCLRHVGIVVVDQPLARVQRAQRCGVEQRVAVAEADLRQPRALAHQHRKRARADLGIERPVIARLDAVEAARLVGDHAGEDVEPAGRALGIGGGGDVVGQAPGFRSAARCRRSRSRARRRRRARSRAASARRCAGRPWCPARAGSSRARGRRLRRAAGRGSPAGSGRGRSRRRAGSRRPGPAPRSCGRAGCPCGRVQRRAARRSPFDGRRDRSSRWPP